MEKEKFPALELAPDALGRLIEQGVFFLRSFHEEYAKDKTGRQTSLWWGELAGWRNTVETLFGSPTARDVVQIVQKRSVFPMIVGSLRERAKRAASFADLSVS